MSSLVRPRLLLPALAILAIFGVLIGRGLAGENEQPATTATRAQAPIGPGYGPHGDVLKTAPETGGPDAVYVKNPQKIHRWLTDTSEVRTLDLLVKLARERLRNPSQLTLLGTVRPANNGTLALRMRGGRPARTLRVIVDTRKPNRLTLSVNGRRWKTVRTDAAYATPGPPPRHDPTTTTRS